MTKRKGTISGFSKLYKVEGKIYDLPKDLAEHFGVTLPTIRAWIKKRITPCGKMIRVVHKER